MCNLEAKVTEVTKRTLEASPLDLIRDVLNEFGDRIVLSSSLGAEDQVLTHMLCQVTDTPKIFTLDTGRLPQETYDVLDRTREHFGIEIEVLFPEASQTGR